MAMRRTRAISHKTLELQVGIGRPASGDLDLLCFAKFKFTDTLFYIKEGIGDVSGPEHPHRRNLRSTGRHHTHNSNPSEADDEEDDAESTSDEEVDAAYRAAHYTTVTMFLGHVKRHGLQSGDGGYLFIALFGSSQNLAWSMTERVGTILPLMQRYISNLLQARIKKRLRSDFSNAISTPTDGDKQLDEPLATPRAVLCRSDGGRGRAAWGTPSRHDSNITDGEWGQDTKEMEVQIDPHDRSSVEVEQILPPHEPVQDPRDFYACDSPVLDNPNSDIELYESAKEFGENVDPRVQDGPQASGSFVRPHTPKGYQQESHAAAASSPYKVTENSDRTHGSRGRGSHMVKGRHGRSPFWREADKNSLAKLVRTELSSLLKDNPPYGLTLDPSRISVFMAEWEHTGHAQ
ncbi:hypothetical protein EDB85DRAFT_1896500 [Lactarius pseudohatsudake]|nr:hypothetical protein EDB85DRAFT_1896500 [Lactarius pseudohatsudake]